MQNEDTKNAKMFQSQQALAQKTKWYQEYWSLMTMTFAEWNADNASRLSAALAYYTIFSLAPLLVIMVIIAGFVIGRETAQGTIVNQVLAYTNSPEAAQLVQTVIENNRSVQGPNILASAISLGILFYGASGAFNELRNALNLIWDVPAREKNGVMRFVLGRAVSLMMVLIAGLLLLLSLIISTGLAFTSRYIDRLAPGMGSPSQILGFILLFLITVLVFALIYKFVPDIELTWSDVWIGAIATGLLFSLGRWGISIYVSQSNIASLYGAAGSVILLLVWVNYSALIFFLGAEFTQVYGRTLGSRVVEEILVAEPKMTRAPVTVESEEGIILPALLLPDDAKDVLEEPEGDGEASSTEKVAETTPAQQPDTVDHPAPRTEQQPGRLRRAGRSTVTATASVVTAVTVIAALSLYSLVRDPFRRD
ncbi:MAG TPA: YihY/virulence factor BrkB family protein [Caldilinea sp.]|nr:YihY/virulence factor BrkB family protein [Anaerolineales bacterium]HRA68585.1 YihY/virulence factor BrkB family protein [Caldilinea sp.]